MARSPSRVSRGRRGEGPLRSDERHTIVFDESAVRNVLRVKSHGRQYHLALIEKTIAWYHLTSRRAYLRPAAVVRNPPLRASHQGGYLAHIWRQSVRIADVPLTGLWRSRASFIASPRLNRFQVSSLS